MQKIKNKMLIILIILTLIVPFFITPISFAYDNIISTNGTEEINKNLIEEDTENNNKEENDINVKEEDNNETENNTNDEEYKNETEDTNKEENENIKDSDSEKETETEVPENKMPEKEIENELPEKTEIEPKSDEIEEGIYYIKTSIDEKRVLDVKDNSKENGASIQLWEKSAQNTDNQKFEITKTESGNYIIKAMHSGKVLEEKEGSKIQQYEINNKETQEWIINKTEDGYYKKN